MSVKTPTQASGERPCLVELQDIRKSYGSPQQTADDPLPTQVLQGISLKIQAGEFVAIVGASGSGKSTLMNILGCLDRPSSGRYLFEGKDVEDFDADQLARLRREAFGFVFQGYHLVATESARENVEIPALYAGMPAAKRRTRATALLERLAMGARLDHRPHQLSGGQQQRVALARMPLIADSLASGDLVEVLPGFRLDSPLVYWLLVGPRTAHRPEVKAFSDWLVDEASRTRHTVGEVPDTDLCDDLG